MSLNALGISQISVNTADLPNGATIGSYLVDSAGALLTSTLIGAKQSLDVLETSSHLQGSAYAAGVDYLSSIGVVDNAGNWVPFTLNAAGELPVAATINQSGDYPEDSPHVSGDVGLFSLAVRRDARTSGTSADGDYASFNVNANGELWVYDSNANATLVSILADTATIDSQTLSIQNTLLALSKAEDAPASSGDQGIQALLVRQDTLASSTSADGDYGSFKSNNLGELYVKDTSSAASLASILSEIQSITYAEDSASANGDPGVFSLAVRRDAQGSNVSASGDYSEFQTWSEGSLKVVDISNGTILQQQVSITSTASQVPAANLANRKSLMIQNTGSVKMYVGSATVTTTGATAGIELAANSFMELEVGPAVNVFVIKSGAGGATLNVLETA